MREVAFVPRTPRVSLCFVVLHVSDEEWRPVTFGGCQTEKATVVLNYQQFVYYVPFALVGTHVRTRTAGVQVVRVRLRVRSIHDAGSGSRRGKGATGAPATAPQQKRKRARTAEPSGSGKGQAKAKAKRSATGKGDKGKGGGKTGGKMQDLCFFKVHHVTTPTCQFAVFRQYKVCRNDGFE